MVKKRLDKRAQASNFLAPEILFRILLIIIVVAALFLMIRSIRNAALP